MQVKIQKIHPRAQIPIFAHPGDAGMDMCTPERVVVPAGKRVLVPTGLVFELPEHTVGLVWDKSGLAVKGGITLLAGVLDAGYRGEVKLVVLNTSDVDHVFEAGDKVAQLLIQPIIRPEIVEADMLSDTARGGDGFGSTGR